MSKIDVSMCCFYWAGVCEEGGITKKCSDRNCYYKQLQQLKTENKTLNTLFKNYKKDYINSTNKLGEMVLKNGNLYNEKEKYQQCLGEIEEIMKEDCEFAFDEQSNMCEKCGAIGCKLIQQKNQRDKGVNNEI